LELNQASLREKEAFLHNIAATIDSAVSVKLEMEQTV
jgi:hypothetical protein